MDSQAGRNANEAQKEREQETEREAQKSAYLIAKRPD